MSECRVLCGDAEYAGAHAVVEQAYRRQGYNHDGSIWKAVREARTSRTFGLLERGILYGTISLLMDGPAGLPMDAIYGDELQPLRQQGRIAEAVQLALDRDAYRALTGERCSRFAAAPLFREVFLHAVREEVNYLLVCINPAHGKFFKGVGFENIGSERLYGAVAAPAVACAFRVCSEQRDALLPPPVEMMRRGIVRFQ